MPRKTLQSSIPEAHPKLWEAVGSQDLFIHIATEPGKLGELLISFSSEEPLRDKSDHSSGRAAQPASKENRAGTPLQQA